MTDDKPVLKTQPETPRLLEEEEPVGPQVELADTMGGLRPRYESLDDEDAARE